MMSPILLLADLAAVHGHWNSPDASPSSASAGAGGGVGVGPSAADPKDAEKFIRRDVTTGLFSCLYCGQTGKKKHHLTRHVEAKHMEVSYPCQFCGESFKAKYAMQAHIRRVHRDLVN